MVWHAPQNPGFGPFPHDPLVFRAADALEALGLFKLEGLMILEEVCGGAVTIPRALAKIRETRDAHQPWDDYATSLEACP